MKREVKKKEVDHNKVKESEDIMANLFADIDNAPNKEEDYVAKYGNLPYDPNNTTSLANNVDKYINQDYYKGNDMGLGNSRTGIQQQLINNQGARISQTYQNSSNKQNFGANMTEFDDLNIDSNMLNEIEDAMQKDDPNAIKPGQQLPMVAGKRMSQNARPAPKSLNQTQMQNSKSNPSKMNISKLYTQSQCEIDFKNKEMMAEAPKYYNNVDNKDLELYWIDAVEDPKLKSTVHLIGKVQNPKNPKEWCSADVKIKNMKRNIFIFKKMDCDSSMEEFVDEVEGKIKYKHSFIYSKMKIKQVKKHYAFELNVSHGEVDCVKVSYPFDYPAIDIPFEGKTYKGIFGTTYTPTELF